MKQVKSISPEDKPKKRGGIQPRNRTKYTTAQINAMEKLFTVSQYPDSMSIEDLGKALGVTVERISIWFQNRRSKFKRQSKDIQMSWMRKQIFNQDTPRPNPTAVMFAGAPTTKIQTSTSRGQSSPDKCHVLSPPEVTTTSTVSSDSKSQIISNLHYMPESMYYPGFQNYSTSTAPTKTTYSNNNPLLMSHLLNDATTTTPSYYQQQPCNHGNYNNSNYGNLYSNYPYYSQMSSINSTQNAYSSYKPQSQHLVNFGCV